MTSRLQHLARLHEALIAALDANDIHAIEGASRDLRAGLADQGSVDLRLVAPELKPAAERLGRLAEAAAMRVNVLQDHARRRADALSRVRGQAAPATYLR